MRVEDWFAVAVRVFGVVTIISGLWVLLDSFLFKLGYFHYADSTPAYYLIVGLAQIVVGLYLARCAPYLLEFAYPPNDEIEIADGEE